MVHEVVPEVDLAVDAVVDLVEAEVVVLQEEVRVVDLVVEEAVEVLQEVAEVDFKHFLNNNPTLYFFKRRRFFALPNFIFFWKDVGIGRQVGNDQKDDDQAVKAGL